MPVINISSPITISITPPNIDALFENLVPNFLPRISPAIHIMNVTTAIISAHTIAITSPFRQYCLKSCNYFGNYTHLIFLHAGLI